MLNHAAITVCGNGSQSKIDQELIKGNPLSPLISSVNPFPSKFIFKGQLGFSRKKYLLSLDTEIAFLRLALQQ